MTDVEPVAEPGPVTIVGVVLYRIMTIPAAPAPLVSSLIPAY